MLVVSASPAAAIIGGTTAAEPSRPWAVQVVILEKGALNGLCGGTLVTPQRVVTTGNCINGKSVSDIFVVANEKHLVQESSHLIEVSIGESRPRLESRQSRQRRRRPRPGRGAEPGQPDPGPRARRSGRVPGPGDGAGGGLGIHRLRRAGSDCAETDNGRPDDLDLRRGVGRREVLRIGARAMRGRRRRPRRRPGRGGHRDERPEPGKRDLAPGGDAGHQHRMRNHHLQRPHPAGDPLLHQRSPDPARARWGRRWLRRPLPHPTSGRDRSRHQDHQDDGELDEAKGQLQVRCRRRRERLSVRAEIDEIPQEALLQAAAARRRPTGTSRPAATRSKSGPRAPPGPTPARRGRASPSPRPTEPLRFAGLAS